MSSVNAPRPVYSQTGIKFEHIQQDYGFADLTNGLITFALPSSLPLGGDPSKYGLLAKEWAQKRNAANSKNQQADTTILHPYLAGMSKTQKICLTFGAVWALIIIAIFVVSIVALIKKMRKE